MEKVVYLTSQQTDLQYTVREAKVWTEGKEGEILRYRHRRHRNQLNGQANTQTHSV